MKSGQKTPPNGLKSIRKPDDAGYSDFLVKNPSKQGYPPYFLGGYPWGGVRFCKNGPKHEIWIAILPRFIKFRQNPGGTPGKWPKSAKKPIFEPIPSGEPILTGFSGFRPFFTRFWPILWVLASFLAKTHEPWWNQGTSTSKLRSISRYAQCRVLMMKS